MKNLFIYLLLLFSLNANALWIPIEFIGLEQVGGFKISENKTQCEMDNPSKTTECISIVGEYNYRYFKSFDIMKDDLLNPNYEAKSSIVTCTDASDCIAKESAQSCPSSDTLHAYIVIRSVDNSDVYCTRIVSYDQMASGSKQVAVDQATKDIYDATELSKSTVESAISSKIKDMDFGKRLYAIVQIKNTTKGLSKGQRRTLRTNLSSIKEDLMDGNICDAKIDISALTADGTLILSSDLTDIISRIDNYKACP